jgi:hypothetical protein
MKARRLVAVGVIALLMARVANAQPIIFAEDTLRRNFDALAGRIGASTSDLESGLPMISSFCEKLDLPVPRPVTTNQVAKLRGIPFGPDGGSLYITLTNQFEFWIEHGTVMAFSSPTNVNRMGDARLFPLAYGPINLSRDEAIEEARQALQRLGYELSEVYADQEPAKVESPVPRGPKTISFYRIQRNDPLRPNTPAVEVGLSGVDGSICAMHFYSRVFWRNDSARSIPASKHKPGDRP